MPCGTVPWASKAPEGIQQPWGDPAALWSWDGPGWGALGCPGSCSAGAVECGMELLDRTWGQDHSDMVVMPGTTLIPTAVPLFWGSLIHGGGSSLRTCFYHSTSPAGRNVLAAAPCCAGHAWHPSHPGHAGDATGMGTALSTLHGFGDRLLGCVSHSQLWGHVLHPPPSAASPSSPSPQPDSQHLPVPGAGSGPLGGPLPTLPSPPAPGVQECLPGKPCRARVAWELGNLIPGNGGRGQGTFPGCSWSPAPFVSLL